MASNDKAALHLRMLDAESTASRPAQRVVQLVGGRRLVIASPEGETPEGESLGGETIDIRAASGQLELRIRMTEDGPVLQLDGVRLSIHAADDIQMSCTSFSLEASESVKLASKGRLDVASEGEMGIQATEGDVRVRGKIIYLN